MAKNPIYRDIIAPNDARHRQELIKKIQPKLGGSLIVYTANPGHPFGLVMSQDTLLFEDVLRSLTDESHGYLMLTSPGGDPNAAEKLLFMCRKRFTDGFCVVVPNYAKSAATMIALGSDKILMGYLAELGPIDPQLQVGPLPGPSVPARSFIDGLENIRTKIREGDPVNMYVPMLSKIRPELIAICQSAIEDSESFAAKWLKQYMLKDNHNQADKVAEWLSRGQKYKSHGKVIDFAEAKDVLKLETEEIDKDSQLWDEIWELYARSVQQLQLTGAAKLFENEHVSLSMNIDVAPQQSHPPARPQRQATPPKPEQANT